MSYATLCHQFEKQAMMAWYIAMAMTILFFLSNIMWYALWSQYDHTYTEITEYSIEQDADGTNIISNSFNQEAEWGRE